MLSGSKIPGPSITDLPPDTVTLDAAIALEEPQHLVRVGAYLDGQGPSDAAQVIRGVLYTAAGILVAAGATVTVADGQEPGWVWLTFPGLDGLILPSGSYRYGVHSGVTGDGARLYTSEASSQPGNQPGNAALLVQTATPSSSGPYLWFHTDGSGAVLEIVVNDAPGAPEASNAALFVQSVEPEHEGPYVWYRVDAEGVLLDVSVEVGTGEGDPTDGDVALFIQASEPSHAYPFVWFCIEGASVFLEVNFGGEGSRTVFPGHTFTDGAPVSIAGGTNYHATASFMLETIDAVRLPLPTAVDDDYLATLPFDVTQRVFGAAGKIRATHTSAVAGWYGTSFDVTTGANAIVRSDGMLGDLVGERILVTRRKGADERAVAVYVHDEREFPDELADEDLLLSKRAFLALDDQALDSLDVTVDVLA